MSPTLRDVAGLVPEVFTVEEAASILRVKKSWLEKKAAARQIPFSMLGGCYRFSPEHLRWIFASFEETPVEITTPTSQTSVPMIRRKRQSPVEKSDRPIVPLRPRPDRSRQRPELAA